MTGSSAAIGDALAAHLDRERVAALAARDVAAQHRALERRAPQRGELLADLDARRLARARQLASDSRAWKTSAFTFSRRTPRTSAISSWL